jgi:hypothetical protein
LKRFRRTADEVDLGAERGYALKLFCTAMAGAGDRFAFYGGGISLIGAQGERSRCMLSTRRFRFTGLSRPTSSGDVACEEGRSIRCTDGKAAVFAGCSGSRAAPDVRTRHGRPLLCSQKRIDVFKGKKHAEPLRAYQALVTTQQRAGPYSMACAAGPSLASA